MHKRCDANECRCPKGRNYVKNSGQWLYYRCHFCGGVGIHAACRGDNSTEPFGCDNCTEKNKALTHLSMVANCTDKDDESNAEGNGKVRKRRTNQTSKPVSSGDERTDMRNYRIEAFFASADFDSKPAPLPWLI